MAVDKKSEKIQGMIDLLKMNDKFVILDIETSELSPTKGARIIELGAVKVENGKIVDTFSQLINPEQKIYAKTTQLTGITNEMLQGKPVYRQVLPDFHKFIGDGVVVAHNSGFDWDRFLLYFFKQVCIFPENNVICTLTLSKHLYPNKSKHSLDEMCTEFKIERERKHRAIDDAMATAQILLLYKQKVADCPDNSNNQIDLFAYQPAFNNHHKRDMIIQSEPVTKIKNFQIKRVKYWSPDENTNKKSKKRRLYITLNIGTAYFDIPTRSWGNKDIKESINFDTLQSSVLKYLKLNTVDDLCSYRN